ncbi:uncharacterized protein LOC141641486 [Silene latifolia]|uniref:uncharacterized protein LOC141641486 n=1 Tax=Silene latifolia TaxID=37657 RepID=UPI003D76AB12
MQIERALCDLGASISLMPLKIFKKLKDYELSPTRVSLQLADRSVRYLIGLVEDVPLKVGKLEFPCDFYVMDIPEDSNIPIILGRPCLATGGALIDVNNGNLSLQVGEEKVEFSLNKAMKEPSEEKSCYMIDMVEECVDMRKFDEDKGLQVFLEGKVKDCKEHREYALAMEATIEEDPNKEFESLRRDEFDIEIRNKKGVENVVPDHLSRLFHEKVKDGLPIDDSLPDDQLFALALMDVPWYADYVNYLVSGVILHDYDSHKRNTFFHDLRQYFWDEPCLYKSCADGIIRRCIPSEEVKPIISHCHDMPSGGHGSSRKTAARVLQCVFYWPTLFHDMASYVKGCDKCQRSGNISRRHEMPTNYILEVELFDVWGIDY